MQKIVHFPPTESPICVAFFLKWGKHIITLYCYARVNFRNESSPFVGKGWDNWKGTPVASWKNRLSLHAKTETHEIIKSQDCSERFLVKSVWRENFMVCIFFSVWCDGKKKREEENYTLKGGGESCTHTLNENEHNFSQILIQRIFHDFVKT